MSTSESCNRYRFVVGCCRRNVVGIKWIYQRVGIAGATNILRAEASPKISEAKSEQKTFETPTSLAHRAQRSVPENRALDKTIDIQERESPRCTKRGCTTARIRMAGTTTGGA